MVVYRWLERQKIEFKVWWYREHVIITNLRYGKVVIPLSHFQVIISNSFMSLDNAVTMYVVYGHHIVVQFI